jgi:hypothetical protein
MDDADNWYYRGSYADVLQNLRTFKYRCHEEVICGIICRYMTSFRSY